MRSPSVRTLLAVLAALVALAACGGGEETSGASASGEASPAATPQSAAAPPVTPSPEVPDSPEAPDQPAVPEVLDFSAPTLDGSTFEGASLAGRDALLWFWAPWCPVCQREAPVLASLAEEYEGRVEVVGIGGLSGSLEDLRGFVERGGVEGLTHVADTEGAVYARFGVTSQYDVGVLTDSGEVRIVTGPLTEAQLRAELDALAEG